MFGKSTHPPLLAKTHLMEECNYETTKAEKNPEESRHMCFFNRYMLSTKAALFTSFAARACSFRYMAVFLASIGFAASKIGIMAGIAMFVRIAGNLVMPAIADRRGRHGQVLFLTCLLFTLCIFPLPWVEIVIRNPNERMLCLSSTQSLDCFKTKLFVVFAAFYALGCFFGFAIGSFIDTRTHQLVSICPIKTSYREQRVYGAIGFGLGPVIAGLFADYIPSPYMSE